MLTIKDLIDDWSVPLNFIVARKEFKPEDFEYMLKCFPQNKHYQLYSKTVPFSYVIKNLDKPWSWRELSKNETITYKNYLKYKSKFNEYYILENKGLLKNFILEHIKFLPIELLMIITDYIGSSTNNQTKK